MAHENGDQDELREAAEEIRRAGDAAAAEIRIELGEAGRETREALREAMNEIRVAFGEAWGAGRASASDSGRMSRAERKELTRELLLDAAIDVFAERGYHGASLDDVAEAAGFTKGAVYSNFTRKSDLFRALLERETRRRGLALRQAVEAVPLELLPDVLGELMRRPGGEQTGDTLMVEFRLAAMRDPSLRVALLEPRDELAGVLERKLRSSGVRPGLDGAELAILVEALATGLLIDHGLDPGHDHHVLFTKAIHKLVSQEPSGRPGDLADD